jgi:hypothetical protein
MARLAKSLFNHGGEIRTSSPVLELMVDQGHVRGVVYQTPNGPQTLLASKGVVLATGGFAHNPALREKFFPHLKPGQAYHSPAPLTNTGDGLDMALKVGVDMDAQHSTPAGWAPVSLLPVGPREVKAFPHLIDRQKPGFIAVTRKGHRFVNEANSYHDVGLALIKACEDEPEICAFLIADYPTMRRYGMGAVKPAPSAHLCIVVGSDMAGTIVLAKLVKVRRCDDAHILQAHECVSDGRVARVVEIVANDNHAVTFGPLLDSVGHDAKFICAALVYHSRIAAFEHILLGVV